MKNNQLMNRLAKLLILLVVMVVCSCSSATTITATMTTTETITEKQTLTILKTLNEDGIVTSNSNKIILFTPAQKEIYERAVELLKNSPQSRSSLFAKLIEEGVNYEDCTNVIDCLGVNWSEQAYLKALEYLKDNPYSSDELIYKLRIDGFTLTQSEYGAYKSLYLK